MPSRTSLALSEGRSYGEKRELGVVLVVDPRLPVAFGVDIAERQQLWRSITDGISHIDRALVNASSGLAFVYTDGIYLPCPPQNSTC